MADSNQGVVEWRDEKINFMFMCSSLLGKYDEDEAIAFFKKAGFEIDISDEDIVYMVWKGCTRSFFDQIVKTIEPVINKNFEDLGLMAEDWLDYAKFRGDFI